MSPHTEKSNPYVNNSSLYCVPMQETRLPMKLFSFSRLLISLTCLKAGKHRKISLLAHSKICCKSKSRNVEETDPDVVSLRLFLL